MFTIKGRLLLIAPEVAVTKMVLVPASRMDLLVDELLPVLHPARVPIATANIPKQSNGIRRLRLSYPTSNVTKGSGSRAANPTRFDIALLAETAVGLMVSDVEAEFPLLKDNCAGLKLQAIPIGSPEQLKDTGPVAPYFDAICTVSAVEAAP
jgi:hypothetical protein